MGKIKFKPGRISEEDLRSLKGKRLGCTCKPDICHGDILSSLVNKLFLEV